MTMPDTETVPPGCGRNLYQAVRASPPPFIRMLKQMLQEPKPTRTRKRRPTLTKIVRQATKAGLSVTGIRPDGTLVVGKPGETSIDASDIETDEAMLEARREWR